jgi:hypothetical protein
MATYERLKAGFEEIVAIEKQYFLGKAMAPIKEMDPGGMGSPGELHKVKKWLTIVVVFDYLQCAC